MKPQKLFPPIDIDQARVLATKAGHRYISLLGRADEKFWYFSTLANQYCADDQKKDKERALSFQSKIIFSFFTFFTLEHEASLELREQVSDSFLNYIDEATKSSQSLNQENPLSETVFQSSHNISQVLREMLDQTPSL